MTALKMTVDDALERADDWIQGTTFHADSKGANAIMLVLATEVRRLQSELARTERNRDMWQGQVRRQSERISVLREHLVDAAAGKQTGKEMEGKASAALKDKRSTEAAKDLAASLVSQANKKR